MTSLGLLVNSLIRRPFGFFCPTNRMSGGFGQASAPSDPFRDAAAHRYGRGPIGNQTLGAESDLARIRRGQLRIERHGFEGTSPPHPPPSWPDFKPFCPGQLATAPSSPPAAPSASSARRLRDIPRWCRGRALRSGRRLRLVVYSQIPPLSSLIASAASSYAAGNVQARHRPVKRNQRPLQVIHHQNVRRPGRQRFSVRRGAIGSSGPPAHAHRVPNSPRHGVIAAIVHSANSYRPAPAWEACQGLLTGENQHPPK